MSYIKRYSLLMLVTGTLVLWAGGLGGGAAWLFRGFALVAGIAIAASWSIKPWREMSTAAKRVQNGDFSARLDDVTPGDLQEPARAFNAMAERLAEFRRLSEEREGRFQAVIAAGGRTILLMDGEGKILLTSPATRKMFPRFRDDAMVASLGLPGLSQLVEDAIRIREPKTETLSESASDRGRVFDARVVPLDDGGAVVILDERTAEMRLDRVKADLVANVSHELRTPLAAVASLIETLESKDLSPEQRGHFEERLKRQVSRMESLVEDLLSLSKLEGGRIDISVEKVDLGCMIVDIFASLEREAISAKVTLRREIPDGFELNSDRLMLETVLKNLVDNAIRYNRPGGDVRVTAFKQNGSAMLAVEDSGEGIPPQHLDRIFERFYRVDPHRSREKGGTGLGLAIVKHAVGQLGGTIFVESAPGRGTTFRLEFPLGTAQPA